MGFRKILQIPLFYRFKYPDCFSASPTRKWWNIRVITMLCNAIPVHPCMYWQNFDMKRVSHFFSAKGGIFFALNDRHSIQMIKIGDEIMIEACILRIGRVCNSKNNTVSDFWRYLIVPWIIDILVVISLKGTYNITSCCDMCGVLLVECLGCDLRLCRDVCGIVLYWTEFYT